MLFFLLFLLDSPDWPLPFYISSPLGSVWSSPPPEDTVFPSTPDERSNVLFILLYMKGGSTGPCATQKINSILYPAHTEQVTWAWLVSELEQMFVGPKCQATTLRKL